MMTREQAYITMLDALVSIQESISLILESKAIEAEKGRNWIVGHLTPGVFNDHEHQVKFAFTCHDQLLEVIVGITKMEASLGNQLHAALSGAAEDPAPGLANFAGDDDR